MNADRIKVQIDKLAADRDRWKRIAQDRAPVTAKSRRREVDSRREAVWRLVHGWVIELGGASRGLRVAIWDALESLDPEMTTPLGDDEQAAYDRAFPERVGR